MDIRTVTVIGATGTMGANIAGIFASFGNAKVYCVGRDIEKVNETIPKIVKSVKADAIQHNLYPADFSMLEKCVMDSDMVFESVAEDISIKAEIASIVGTVLQPDAISCTGTSGLSITTIAECYPEEVRCRFFGVHMFNPPYALSLCELISTKYSDMNLKNKLKEYLIAVLIRTVVEVKDSPAFLGNRIGFQFINESLQYANKYKNNGGIDYIDAILGPFTGRAMAPIATADFVGLDVHKAIVDNLYRNTHDYAHATFALPSYVQKKITEGRLGRKTGGGLYKLIKGKEGFKKLTVFDIEAGEQRAVIQYEFPFVDKMKNCIAEGDYQKAINQLLMNNSLEAEICLSFLLKYIVYSLYVTREIGYSIDSADDVMATGFNWCPPLALFQALASIVNVPDIIKSRLPDVCMEVDVDRLFAEVIPSRYDYRMYFRSGR